MTLASIPWWGWLIIGGVCYFVQLNLSIGEDLGSRTQAKFRIVFVALCALSLLICVIRFVKWVWQW
jgi:hypothetical protein